MTTHKTPLMQFLKEVERCHRATETTKEGMVSLAYEATQEVAGRKIKHYKGGEYVIISVGICAERDCFVVHYVPASDELDGVVEFTRSIPNFTEFVPHPLKGPDYICGRFSEVTDG